MAGLFNPIGWWDASEESTYRVADLYNYFDIADSNSFTGLGNNVLNLAINGNAYPATFTGTNSYTSPNNYVSMTGGGSSQGNMLLNGGGFLDPLPLAQDFTFEAGFRMPQAGVHNQSLLNWRRNTSAGLFWAPNEFTFQGVVGYSWPSSVTNLYNNTDFFVNTVSVTGTNLKLYVNGVLAHSTTITSTRSAYTANTWTRYGAKAIGSSINGGNDIDYSYFRQYNNYALTALEVKDNFNYNAPALGLSPI